MLSSDYSELKESYEYAESKASMRSLKVQAGDMVERFIDGLWFLGEVQNVENSYVTIKYIDDNNIESMVPIDEVRIPIDDIKGIMTRCSSIKDSLPKPLLGLVDDDSEARLAHRPTIILHSNAETGGITLF